MGVPIYSEKEHHNLFSEFSCGNVSEFKVKRTFLLSEKAIEDSATGTRQVQGNKHNNNKPSHHDNDPLDVSQIQWFRIWFRLAAVGRPKLRPANLEPGLIQAGKVVFPADRARLAAIGTSRQDLVLDYESVLLPIALGDLQVQAVEAARRQVPVLRVWGPLRGEPGPSECRDV